MKLQRHRFRLMALVLLVLIGFLGASLVLRSLQPSSALLSLPDDAALQSLKESVVPGNIADRNGTLLASTVDGIRKYADPATRRASLVHLVGTSSGLVPSGAETLYAAYLYAARPGLAEAFSRLIKKQERRGYDLALTVSTELCEEILRSAASHPETAGKKCCAVVVQYETGEIAALASLPTFDPEAVTEESAEALKNASDQPLKNRASEGVYPLGTLSAVFSEDILEALPLSFRDLPVAASAWPSSTPVKLCLAACAAAGDGVLPEPRLIRTVKTGAGGVVLPWSEASLGRVFSAETAKALRDGMKASVSGGDSASLYDPILDIHAFCGVAEEETPPSRNVLPDPLPSAPSPRYAWCVAFNGQKDLPFALCVLVEDLSPEDTAAGTAALIAGDLFAWLKSHPQLV